MGADARKPDFGVGEQQRGRPAWASAQTDQHHNSTKAHPGRLIRALVIRFLECIISKLAAGDISSF